MATVAGSVKWVEPTAEVPAYYPLPPARAYNPVLHGEQLTGPAFGHGYQVAAYRMAAKIERVLYAQPCGCRCDLALRHKSLHSCFEGTHGAACATCMREAVYAYQQTQLGKTPEEIRAGVLRGEWRNIEVQNAAM